MRPVDAHCHLDFDRFDGDRDHVLERCRERLEFVVNAGREPDSNRVSLELEERYRDVVANLGLHPTHTDSFDRVEEVVGQIRQNDPAAIGEIGLDHHHVNDGKLRDDQEKVFRQLLELAEEMDKPVVVHSRDAERKTFEILQDHGIEAMLHCFNGSIELAEQAVEEGMKIGVTTQVLYSNRVQDIAEQVPLDAMLLETDSPFLYRGGRNEPVNVEESAEKIAGIKGVEKKRVVEATTGNARELFL